MSVLKWALGGITLAIAALWPRRANASLPPGGALSNPATSSAGGLSPGILQNAGSAGGLSPYSGTHTVSAAALRLPTDRWQPPAKANPYLAQIRVVEGMYGLPRNLLAALIATESGFDANARNPSGAVGIAQIIPRWHPEIGGESGALDPSRAINYAGKLIRQYRDQLGSWELALAAYNRGVTVTRQQGLNNLPPETAAYLPKILSKVG